MTIIVAILFRDATINTDSKIEIGAVLTSILSRRVTLYVYKFLNIIIIYDFKSYWRWHLLLDLGFLEKKKDNESFNISNFKTFMKTIYALYIFIENFLYQIYKSLLKIQRMFDIWSVFQHWNSYCSSQKKKLAAKKTFIIFNAENILF